MQQKPPRQRRSHRKPGSLAASLEKRSALSRKAGQPDASEEVRKEWPAEMSAANIVVMNFTSSRLAKVIKGELTVSELQKAVMI